MTEHGAAPRAEASSAGAARFDRVAELFDRFRRGALDPADPHSWRSFLADAGIHPASALLCCQGRAYADHAASLGRALADPGLGFELVPTVSFDTIVAWSPLTYQNEVRRWSLRAGAETRLPDGLLAIQGLTLEDDPRVRALGAGWTVVGGLRLAGLPLLEALPERLEVFGTVELAGLPRLAALGPGIRIHGSLAVSGCPALRALPEDLEVDGAVWADAVPGSLPASLAGKLACPWPGFDPPGTRWPELPAGALALASA